MFLGEEYESGRHLRELTHKPGSAWGKVYAEDESAEMNVNDIWNERWYD
jgi:hypothetical protein